MTDKQTLRAEMRALRRDHVASLPESMRALMFLRPPTPVSAMVPEGAVVGIYHARGAEAPTHSYARWLYENGRHIALPAFDSRDSAMGFAAWRNPFDDGDLEPGPFGILQPVGDGPVANPDVVFVPLLAFTANGERLGQGGGHYDRWLAANPGVAAIGLGWDCQLVDTLPLEPHDRVLDAVVTPTRLYERQG